MPTEPHNPLSAQVDPRASELTRLREESRRLQEIIAQQESRITCIQEIGVALGSTMSLDDLLNVIMEKITILMQADRSTLFLVDHEQNALWSKVIQGDQVNEIRLHVGEGIAGWVAKTGQSINIRNAYQDERFNAEVDMRTGYQTRSILCQPIRNHKGELIGVIQVLNSRNGYFSDADENLLSALASQAAVSIENSMLYLSMVDKNLELTETKIKLEKKIAEVDFLYDIQRLIGQAVDLQDLLQSVASKALDISEAELCAIAIREEGHLRLFSLQRHDDGSESFRVFHVPLDKGICAMVIETGTPYMTNSSGDAIMASSLH
ncbi:MAG: GAF domain-containing protein, partial [Myxococcota bacterium]